MSFLDDLKKIVKDVENDLEDLGDEIEKDLEKAQAAIQKGLDKIKQFSEDEIQKEMKKLLGSKLQDAQDKYGDTVNSAITLLNNNKGNLSASTVQSSVKSALSTTNPSPTAAQSLLDTGPANILQGQPDGSDPDTDTFHGGGFESGSIGASGDIDIGIGLAAAAGAGSEWKGGEPRLIVDFSVSGGEEAGADASVYFAFWRKNPKDLQGAFLGVALVADAEVGAGVKFFFDLSTSPDFIGFAVIVGGGAEEEIAIEIGFTTTFKFS